MTWNERAIEQEILRVKNILCIDRMPSNREIVEVNGNTKLSNAIAKRGGFRFWAKKLNLNIKRTDTEHGYTQELAIIELLQNRGYEAEITPTKFPYDVLVNGCVKIDVKCAHASYINGYSTYAFHISKKMPTCDLYVIACLNDDDAIQMLYIIPAYLLKGQVQIVISGSKVSAKYRKYLDRWDIVDQYCEAFKTHL